MVCWSEFLDRKTEAKCNPDCPLFGNNKKIKRIIFGKLSTMKHIDVTDTNVAEVLGSVKLALPTLRRAVENELRRESVRSLEECDNRRAGSIPLEFEE